MWEQYKKTFRGMQIAIGLVVLGIFLVTRNLRVSAVFLATMEIGAILGASWGVRLKRILARPTAGRLPSRPA